MPCQLNDFCPISLVCVHEPQHTREDLRTACRSQSFPLLQIPRVKLTRQAWRPLWVSHLASSRTGFFVGMFCFVLRLGLTPYPWLTWNSSQRSACLSLLNAGIKGTMLCSRKGFNVGLLTVLKEEPLTKLHLLFPLGSQLYLVYIMN